MVLMLLVLNQQKFELFKIKIYNESLREGNSTQSSIVREKYITGETDSMEHLETVKIKTMECQLAINILNT
jgi:hypothetical protein